MEREFYFGKVDYHLCGRKDCPVTLGMKLKKKKEEGFIFSAWGNIWNHIETDTLMGGQCIEDIWNFFGHDIENPALFWKIMGYWKLYHLNNMHPGTPEQELEIKRALANGVLRTKDYEAVCAYLKSIDLYQVMYNGKPYRYGQSWLYRDIPQTDLKDIIELLESDIEHLT